MGEIKHTAEPWENNCGAFIETSNGTKIAQTFNKQEENFENAIANAARIVACVNACKGMTSEQLAELPQVIYEGTLAITERNELKRERDELRLEGKHLRLAIAALESIVEIRPANHGGREACFALAVKTAQTTLLEIGGHNG